MATFDHSRKQAAANKPRTYITTNLSQPQISPQHTPTPQPTPNPDAPINRNVDENGRPAWWSRMKFDTPRTRVQPKLTVGAPNDQYEQEADKVAAEVVNQISAPQQPSVQREEMPEEDALQMKPLAGQITPLVQREETASEEEDLQTMSVQREEMATEEEDLQTMSVQRVAAAEGMDASPDVETGIEQARGSGQPLDKTIREPMEQAFGADFSGVKVHTDAQADQLNHAVQAKAFTTKQDVFFRQGEYNPGSRGGQELIAHELTHVAQQNVGAVQRSQTLQPKLSIQQKENGMIPHGRITHIAQRHSATSPQISAAAPMVQRALGDDVDWAGAGAIKRSGAGAEGVIFVTTSSGEIIVKFLNTAAGTELANKTLSKTGIEVPDSRIVGNDAADPVGGKIRALINAKMEQLQELQRVQVTNQLENYQYIQIQQKAVGVPLDQLNSEQIQAFIRNAALIQEVGKLAAVDAFLGNTDRLSRTTVNTGNYIVNPDGDQGPTLIAIDNETKAKVASGKTAREGEVRFVFSDEGAKELATSFIVRLTRTGVKYFFSGEEQASVEQNMRLGIIAGAEVIVELLKTEPQFINQAKTMEQTELPGPEGTGTRNREIVRKTLNARLAAIKDQYQKNGWDQLEPALDQ